MVNEYDNCPYCGIALRVTNNKFVRHERGLPYMPYKLYKAIERLTGTPVKEQSKKNLCKGSEKEC